MKKILITGAGSYIGTSLAGFLAQWPRDYQVDTLDVIGEGWRQADLSGYDAIFHVAGIAHQKETAENAPLYYKVNRDLAVEIRQLLLVLFGSPVALLTVRLHIKLWKIMDVI